MPIKIRVVAEKPAKGVAAEQKPIFDRYRDSALDKLLSEEMEGTEPNVRPRGSLLQAKGRFEGEGMAYETPTASHNWKVVGPAKDAKTGKYVPVKQRVAGKMERVEVHLKAGSRRVAILEHPDTGEICKSIEVPSENVVAILNDFVSLLQDMTPDSEDGKIFHADAILAATPRFKKGKEKKYDYCAKTDNYVIHESAAAQKAWQASNG